MEQAPTPRPTTAPSVEEIHRMFNELHAGLCAAADNGPDSVDNFCLKSLAQSVDQIHHVYAEIYDR